MDNQNLLQLMGDLDNLLSTTDLKDVTSEGAGFDAMPDGYYLCEVTKAELKESKSSHQPMAAFQFKAVEDGVELDEDANKSLLKGTKNRLLFVYYVLKDEGSVKRFVTDMLKFEGSEAGKPLLEKEYFMHSETLVDALQVLVGRRLYIQVSTSEKDDGTTSTWQNLISWKRAEALELVSEE